MAEKPSGQCEACGYIRYPNDMINFGCQSCAAWAVDQIHALRAEVENWKAEAVERGKDVVFYSELHDSAVEEVSRLQAELEKYTTPLTDEQIGALIIESGHITTWRDAWRLADAAIRAAREGA